VFRYLFLGQGVGLKQTKVNHIVVIYINHIRIRKSKLIERSFYFATLLYIIQ